MHITTPVVNMNGNTKAELIQQAMAIHHAIEAACRVLAESDLAHGRNFQTVSSSNAQFEARNQRASDCAALKLMGTRYMDMACEIDQQGGK